MLSVCGPVSGYVLKRLRADVQAHAPRPLRAFCLRLDRAMVAVSGRCLDELSAEASLSVSAAIVVAPALQAVFQDYAMRAAERGLVRVIFTSPAEALGWVSAQARLAQNQSVWAARTPARALLIAA